MGSTDSDLDKVKNQLSEYKNKIENGQLLDPHEDYLEVDFKGGRIWLHPQNNGTKVKIHWFNDIEESDTVFSGTGQIFSHLTQEINFPSNGYYKPFNTFFSSERRSYRIDYQYFQD